MTLHFYTRATGRKKHIRVTDLVKGEKEPQEPKLTEKGKKSEWYVEPLHGDIMEGGLVIVETAPDVSGNPGEWGVGVQIPVKHEKTYDV
jgi:hypothetical protein